VKKKTTTCYTCIFHIEKDDGASGFNFDCVLKSAASMYRKERKNASNLPFATIEGICKHLPCDHHTTSEEWLQLKFAKKSLYQQLNSRPLLPKDLKNTKSEHDQGIKFDEGKQNWYAMPLEILEPLADVFRAGEKKYETFNCLKPFDDPARRFYDATMRHMEAQQLDPLAKDPDTGCYHAAQIAFNALLRLYNCRKLQEKENENAARKE